MIKRCFIPMLSLAFLLTSIESAKAESTSVFDDSASFTVAKAVSLGRSTSISNKGAKATVGSSQSSNTTTYKECDTHCVDCNHATGKCRSCEHNFAPNANGICIEQPNDPRDTQCVNLCGDGYVYDRPGAKRNGQEKVCTRYKLPCGYNCTTGWEFDYLVNGTDYTCQDAIQTEDKDALCKQICEYEDHGNGSDYFYDRPGDLKVTYQKPGRGESYQVDERVCTRYPLDCGYNCTTGWEFHKLVTNQKNGLTTNYTCQKAEQASDEVECNRLCGEGSHYDRLGDLELNGQREKVCTKYPLTCGYNCTTGWDIHTLVEDPDNGNQKTNYTCQTAIQTSDETECKRICGDGFHYDRPGDQIWNGQQEKVCTKYPEACGYSCTTGWNIELFKEQNYTCQTAIQVTHQSECKRLCGDGFHYDRTGDSPLNGETERVCTKYPLECGYACTTGWNIQQHISDPKNNNQASNYTCQTAIQDNKETECKRLCKNDGFHYDRLGDLELNGEKEKVCTYYPLECGYACTVSWNIQQLVTDPETEQQTSYTCQTAVQDDGTQSGYPVTDMLGTVRLQTTINNPHSATYTTYTAAGMTCADSYFATRDRANMVKTSNQVVITPYGENVCGYKIANCPANCAECNAGTTGYHPTCTTCNDGFTLSNGACVQSGFPVTDALGTVYLRNGIGTPNADTYTTYNANGLTCKSDWYATYQRVPVGNRETVILPYGSNACGYRKTSCPTHCSTCTTDDTGQTSTCTRCDSGYNLVDQGTLKVCTQEENPCAGVSHGGMPRFCTGGRYLVQGKGCCANPDGSGGNCSRCCANGGTPYLCSWE